MLICVIQKSFMWTFVFICRPTRKHFQWNQNTKSHGRFCPPSSRRRRLTVSAGRSGYARGTGRKKILKLRCRSASWCRRKHLDFWERRGWFRCRGNAKSMQMPCNFNKLKTFFEKNKTMPDLVNLKFFEIFTILTSFSTILHLLSQLAHWAD